MQSADEVRPAVDRRGGLRVVHLNDIASVGSELVAAQRALGAEATLVEPWRPLTRMPYPWKAATLPLRAAGLLAAGIEARTRHAELAHVHFARLGILGPLSGLPYILHCHGTDIRGTAPGGRWATIVAPFLRGARRVYYATPDLRDWVEPFRSDAVFLPNPIDTIRFAPGPGAVADSAPATGHAARADRIARGTAGRETGAAIDLLVGVRLDPIKGLDAIVAVVREVRRLRPVTSVTIIDQGTGVRRAVDAAGGPGPGVAILPRLPHAALPDLFRGHRVALGQLLVGSLGNYELEAMASGLPVAAAFSYAGAYDAPPPLIAVGPSGGAADAASAAAGIAALLDDEAARLALAREGARWVESHHAAETIARRLLADYATVLGRT